MTRGQEALIMDLMPQASAAESAAQPLNTLDLPVLAATDEERAAHERLLAGIDKASKGACVWKKLEAASG
jgi:DNA polymerase-3 subunit epsilon